MPSWKRIIHPYPNFTRPYHAGYPQFPPSASRMHGARTGSPSAPDGVPEDWLPDQGWDWSSNHQDGETAQGAVIARRPGFPRGAPETPGYVPPAVRSRLSRRPRPDLRQSGWDATEAEFDFGYGVEDLPDAGFAQAHRSTPCHSHARLRLAEGVAWRRSRSLGGSSVRTADIYSHAIRGRDEAAAQTWDVIIQRARSEKSKAIQLSEGRSGLGPPYSTASRGGREGLQQRAKSLSQVYIARRPIQYVKPRYIDPDIPTTAGSLQCERGPAYDEAH